MATVQTSTWQGGAGNSNWGTAANWSPSGVPNNGNNRISDYNVVIGSPSPTNLNFDLDVYIDSLTLTSTGALSFSAASNLTVLDNLSNSGSITIDGADSEAGVEGGMNNSGTVILSSNGSAGFEVQGTENNTGTLVAIAAQGAQNGILILGTLSNDGMLVSDGSGAQIQFDGTLTNLSGTTLTGGTYEVENGGTLQLQDSNAQGVSVTTNAAIITLSGPNPNFPAISTMDTNSGSFALQAGAGFSTVGDLSNSETVTVGPAVDANGASSLTVNGNYNQTAGLTQIDGTLTLTGGVFNLSGGTLKGTGTINGSIVNTGGTVSPGDSPGVLSITGDYSQDSNSTLRILIDGTNPGTDYSVLNVTGSAALDGTLCLLFPNGFAPEAGQTFTILTASDGVTGQFATVESPYVFTISYGADDVVLTSVPEPGCLGVLALGGAVLLRRRRRGCGLK